ncbi:MAG: hypothetical protein KDE19_21235 [Caldilineaceae bacterium]|nr:hypothetical protein [Caldilineaceae bacterium]
MSDMTVVSPDDTQAVWLNGNHVPSVEADSTPPTDLLESTAEPILSLILQLCAALRRTPIRWCHWKSNAAIDRSATGENDLDLLVHRGDLAPFTALITGLGFKEAIAQPDKQLPGVLDYYGYDAPSDTVIHLHVHYQLILGHDAAKNYRLPIEEAYLASAQPDRYFLVPAPEFEFVVFVVRMILKHGTWDAMLGLEGRFAKTERLEFDDLLAQIDETRVHAILREHLPFLSVALFTACVDALHGRGSLWRRARIGYALQTQLTAHTRRPAAAALFLRFWRRGMWGIRKYVLRQPARKRFAGGGALIAIIGGDGAGKSSAIKGTTAWLGKTFRLQRMHMGKPRMSLLSFGIKVVLKIGRKLGVWSTRYDAQEIVARGEALRFPGYPWLLWHVVTAHDRYRAYIRARRLSTNGTVVICDRFPLPEVTLMDGARTGWLLAREDISPLVRRLVEMEQAYYRQILPPDLLIVLRVDPQVAQARRTDEEGEWVMARCQEIWDLDWDVEHYGTRLQIVDAGQPQAAVLAQVKAEIWSRL